MIDSLLRSGYQIKTRWATDGAAYLWQWSKFFSSLDEAEDYKTKHQGATDRGWKLEIKIFRIELIDN